MADSMTMYKYTANLINACPEYAKVEPYLLIPTLPRLVDAIDNGVSGVSFITSVSESFQMKNTRKTLEQTRSELKEMLEYIDDRAPHLHTKLYVSCINCCPINGYQDMDYVLNQLLQYSNFDINELCLSDTCGNISFDTFEYIVDAMIVFGFPVSKISVHLHVSSTNARNVEQILLYCFRKGIWRFDVSSIETGGCSVTMHKSTTSANLSYDFFYSTLNKYAESIADA
jgi:hydroxymethylglutaryl-CoA lyase